jgi:hypothetical protein
VYFQMRRRKYIHMLNFIYENDIKVKDKYFATIPLYTFMVFVRKNRLFQYEL